MAAVIGDFVPDLSRFYSTISGSSSSSGPQYQDQHAHDSSSYRSSTLQPPSAFPRSHKTDVATPTTTTFSASSSSASRPAQRDPTVATRSDSRKPSPGGASRFPSPPPSSSPAAAPGPAATDDGNSASMAAQIGDRVSAVGLHQQAPSMDPTAPRRQQPSPPSDDLQASSKPGPGTDSYLVLTSAGSQPAPQNVIHIRDLAHIEGLAMADLAGEASDSAGILHDPPLHQVKYEISGMPIADVIEMVAALLTKITSTNDLQHDAMQRNVAHQQQANQSADSAGGSSLNPLSHSVLAFHGKNVPAITILSYLSRIHKYCPTTYEVFLSLLVYFDRMTERVNDMVARSEQSRRASASRISAASHQDTPMTDDTRSPDESDSDLADDDDEESDDDEMTEPPPRESRAPGKAVSRSASEPSTALSTAATYFVVDSFNIHRLIIAGVTCASKFFSDVFYTNSRYAKVGGLPLPELNHLELQFLVLNDFRLAVPVEELEAYATMLVEFYAREVVAPKNRGPMQVSGPKS